MLYDTYNHIHFSSNTQAYLQNNLWHKIFLLFPLKDMLPFLSKNMFILFDWYSWFKEVTLIWFWNKLNKKWFFLKDKKLRKFSAPNKKSKSEVNKFPQNFLDKKLISQFYRIRKDCFWNVLRLFKNDENLPYLH